MGYVKYLGLRNESIVNMRRYMDRAASRWCYKKYISAIQTSVLLERPFPIATVPSFFLVIQH